MKVLAVNASFHFAENFYFLNQLPSKNFLALEFIILQLVKQGKTFLNKR